MVTTVEHWNVFLRATKSLNSFVLPDNPKYVCLAAIMTFPLGVIDVVIPESTDVDVSCLFTFD